MGVWYECVGKYTNAQSGVGDVVICVPCTYAAAYSWGVSSYGRKRIRQEQLRASVICDMIFFLHLEAELSGDGGGEVRSWCESGDLINFLCS